MRHSLTILRSGYFGLWSGRFQTVLLSAQGGAQPIASTGDELIEVDFGHGIRGVAGGGVQFTFGVAASLGGLFGELPGFVGQTVGQSCEPLGVEGAGVGVGGGGGGSAAEGPDDGADADGEAEAEQRIISHLAGEAVACFFEAAGDGGCFHWVGWGWG